MLRHVERLKRVSQEKEGGKVKDFTEKAKCLMEQVLAEQGGDGAMNTDRVWI